MVTVVVQGRMVVHIDHFSDSFRIVWKKATIIAVRFERFATTAASRLIRLVRRGIIYLISFPWYLFLATIEVGQVTAATMDTTFLLFSQWFRLHLERPCRPQGQALARYIGACICLNSLSILHERHSSPALFPILPIVSVIGTTNTILNNTACTILSATDLLCTKPHILASDTVGPRLDWTTLPNDCSKMLNIAALWSCFLVELPHV